ncbi:unnamed protein product, partial [Brassica oleracea var. botrytis]
RRSDFFFPKNPARFAQDIMGDLNALRQLAFERVDDVTMHVEALINFVQGALTLEQLDRVIDLMHNCSVTAHFILNQ